jgi:hypothetical protein
MVYLVCWQEFLPPIPAAQQFLALGLQEVVAHWGLRIWHFAGYVQDDVKATPKLTFNLGLRYEYASASYEIEDRLGDIADTGPQYGHFLLNPSPLYKPQVVNLSPRLGAAYAVTTKTVVRGGFAVLTNAIPTVYPDQSAVDFPRASLNTLSNPIYSLTPLSVSLPTLTSTTGLQCPQWKYSPYTGKYPGQFSADRSTRWKRQWLLAVE